MFEVAQNHMQDRAWSVRSMRSSKAEAMPGCCSICCAVISATGTRVIFQPTPVCLEQQKRSLRPLDAWFVELLEGGVLAGCDPDQPNCVRSGKWQQEIDVGSDYPRIVTMPGLFDQAREIEPRLKFHTNDNMFAAYLREWGCSNEKRVLRVRGWTFPPLAKLRAEWERRYPNCSGATHRLPRGNPRKTTTRTRKRRGIPRGRSRWTPRGQARKGPQS